MVLHGRLIVLDYVILLFNKIVEKINEEYVKYATYDDIYQIDSGIKNIDSVR